MPTEVPADLRLPDGFGDPRVALPGILTVRGPAYRPDSSGDRAQPASVLPDLRRVRPDRRFPLVVVVDDSEFAARSERNFLWVTFTRSNPAADIDGIAAFCHQKHWGCARPAGDRRPDQAPPRPAPGG